MKNFSILIITLFALQLSCSNKEEASLILINGIFETVTEKDNKVEAIAIKGNRIWKIGHKAEIDSYKGENTKILDLNGHFVMPGFIEGHGHFSGLGKSLMNLNFLHSKNWKEIIGQVETKVNNSKPGEWIEGRGWHQEKWNEGVHPNIQGYPYHYELSKISPDNPVILWHASGHSLYANAKAMEMVGMNVETPDPKGGSIIRAANGEAIGVFEERAMDAFWLAYQEYLKSLPEEETTQRWYTSITMAEKECLENGITSFQDAGTTLIELERYHNLAKEGNLNIRLWSMLREKFPKLKGQLGDLPIIDAGDHFFTCKAIKSEVDGALGAFGAWLLKPYQDKPESMGQNTTPIPDVKGIAKMAEEKDLQLCVHAIGDRANRVTLNIFEEAFKDVDKDRRWRIEHAQHLDAADIPRFKKLGVIASMQGIHCTSDAPFVEKRLGAERSMIGAYPWRSLLDNGVIIANGTDAPVEDVDPLACFYASVTRKRADNGMEFFPEQRMTRKEAIYSYTLGNAYAAFEEKDKGSLEEGKLADFVVLSKNLLTCEDEEILEAEVLWTILDGEIVYEKQ